MKKTLNIEMVRQEIEEQPNTSIRHLQQVDLSYTTCQRILKQDLHLHPYCLQLVHELFQMIDLEDSNSVNGLWRIFITMMRYWKKHSLAMNRGFSYLDTLTHKI
jgi:hypothetical protein